MSEIPQNYQEFEAAMSAFYRILLLCRLPTRTKEDVLWEMNWLNLVPLVPNDALTDSIINRLHMDEGVDIDFDNLLRLVKAYSQASSAKTDLDFSRGPRSVSMYVRSERDQQLDWGWQLIHKYLQRINLETELYSATQLKELIHVLETIIEYYPKDTIAEQIYIKAQKKLQESGYFL